MVSVHDGIVLAADSASTLTVSVAPGTIAGVAKVYNNANKIFNLYKGKSIGCVVFGAGSIGNSSIGTLIKDLRAALMDKKKREKLEADLGIKFNPEDYTMEQVAGIVSKFISRECAKQPPVVQATLGIGLFLAGYSSVGNLGESWSVDFKAGQPVAPKLVRPSDQAGINWGGQSDVLQRIVIGFTPNLYQVLAEVSGAPGQPPVTAEQLFAQLNQLLMTRLGAPLVFPPTPIQDAIDLARYLAYSAVMFSRFLPGASVVGGPIDIAAITKHEGFKWIERKHYYDYEHNQEPRHVIVDKQCEG